MGKFVVALVVFELFCVCHLSYTHPFTDDYDSLYDYSSIDPYRFIGLGHSGRYHSSGSGNTNLGTYRFSGGGSGYSNLGQYQLGGGGSGYSNLGTYRFSGGGSGYSNLGLDHLGSYNSLFDDDGYGDLYRRYSSLGSYQPRGSRYLTPYNIGSNSNLGLNHGSNSNLGLNHGSNSNLGLNHGGYSNLGPYDIGGYSIGNYLVSYLPNRNQRADKYYPDGYSARRRNIYK